MFQSEYKKSLFYIIIIACLLLAINNSYAQKRSVKLLGLSVEGNSLTDANMIQLSSGLTVGGDITAEHLQNAIRQLWNLGVFSDIRIMADREVAEGVFLNIVVQEFPRLSNVLIEGNKKLKTDEIEKSLNFYRGQVISPLKLSKSRQKLKDEYKEKGYLLAKINTEIDTVGEENRVNLTIKIDEGKKVQIKKINFYGNVTFKDGKLRGQMKETKEDKWWRGADFKRDKYIEDKELVLEFYRNHGFRDAEITKDSLYYGENNADMFIDIWVDEGIQYSFGAITWEGNTIYSNQQLERLLGFEQGDVYSKEKIGKAVYEDIGGLYYDNGYIYANINPKEKPVGDDVVDIHFIVVENDQAHINKIHITGNTKTKEKVIRRTLRMLPGDVFNRDLLMRSQREVWMLNYFANVEPRVQPVDEKLVDVELHVEEKSTDTAHMSAGYSERDKMIGNLGVAMNNLFGNGQRLSFDWHFARSYRSFMISFTEPYLLDEPTLASFSFYDTKRDPRYIGYRQRSRGGSVRLGRRFAWPDIYFRGDWIFSVDQTQLSDFNPILLESNPYFQAYEEMGALTSRSIAQIISRNSLDHPEFPRSGSEFSLRTELAGGPFGGNVDFHKHYFVTNWFLPTFWELVLHLNFEAGYLAGFNENSKIPYLEHFFLGGEGMTRSIPLRGYDDPLSGYASDIGNKTLLKYSIELRIPIAPNPTIFGIIFAEAGNAWPTVSDTDPLNLRRSAGIGARVFMPMIGILGFDYAYGFDYVNIDTGERYGKWKPHFVFGKGF